MESHRFYRATFEKGRLTALIESEQQRDEFPYGNHEECRDFPEKVHKCIVRAPSLGEALNSVCRKHGYSGAFSRDAS